MLKGPKNSPAAIHFPDAEFPFELIPLGKLNGTYTGTLSFLHIADIDAVSNGHFMEGISNPFGVINYF